MLRRDSRQVRQRFHHFVGDKSPSLSPVESTVSALATASSGVVAEALVQYIHISRERPLGLLLTNMAIIIICIHSLNINNIAFELHSLVMILPLRFALLTVSEIISTPIVLYIKFVIFDQLL